MLKTEGTAKQTSSTDIGKYLSTDMEKRLVAYAAAAGAGLLMATPAGAASWYNVNIPIAPNDTTPLDLNGDLQDDFWFVHRSSTWTSGGSSWTYGSADLQVYGYNPASPSGPPNAIAMTQSSSTTWGGSLNVARNFSFSSNVDFKGGYSYNALLASVSSSWSSWGSYGRFLNAHPGYLGVRFFDSKDKNQLSGVIRLDVSSKLPNFINATITGYGYAGPGEKMHVGETIPEPGSLSLLALGTLGLAAWRRRKKKAA